MRKLPTTFRLIGTLMSAFLMIGELRAQSANGWTAEKASTWYNRHEWLNGLPAKPADVVDKSEFAKQYHGNKAGWDKAFAFLKNTDFTKLRIGKYPIDDENVFALITEGPAREFSNSKWEAHRTYHDIHYIVRGREKIGIMPVAIAQTNVAEPYNPGKDIAFYTADTAAGGTFHVAEPGHFFIIMTDSAHNPGNKVDGDQSVKKVVVKVKSGR